MLIASGFCMFRDHLGKQPVDRDADRARQAIADVALNLTLDAECQLLCHGRVLLLPIEQLHRLTSPLRPACACRSRPEFDGDIRRRACGVPARVARGTEAPCFMHERAGASPSWIGGRRRPTREQLWHGKQATWAQSATPGRGLIQRPLRKCGDGRSWGHHQCGKAGATWSQ
jgi:hypothetical protein